MPSCAGIRQEFVDCILKSDCVLVNRNTVQECVKNKELKDQVPEKCHMLAKSLFECKRGLLDMRKRTRGVPSAGGVHSNSDD
ncbi:Dephospho-CoA kinase (Dephosphocoenzyme A kinase) (COAE) [Mycoemilia scoparia]|uniref:Dephospho-CoA kinase (Dephosphocoenzyme A kinase) (COAE) n=1 Tax=Mycoemilia scoparia TaxID=417184 RepID=A0A9W8A6F2_9FUNG|nr:Dephospho-CoA kinase (Dephosphocoenzyme A kinase) (COAE) [Mycoemilia scoparia]